MNQQPTRVINAAGTVTRLGGGFLSPAVLQAQSQIALSSVRIDQLQAIASGEIAQRTGAEAGMVTCGAAAALMVGAGAIMCRMDIGCMNRLPDTSNMRHRFLVARTHRTGYDRAVRMAGGTFAEVGIDEVVSGSGVRRIEAWEYETAIDDTTAGIFYTWSDRCRPRLEELVDLAGRHDLPILVDAAAGWMGDGTHPAIECGADLVAISGGKQLAGPQASGILCGRRTLIASALLQSLDLDEPMELWNPQSELFFEEDCPVALPRHGIGRVAKVSKEQIVGLLAAFAECSPTRTTTLHNQWQDRLSAIRRRLAPLTGSLRIHEGVVPLLIISVEQDGYREKLRSIASHLASGDPPIYLDTSRIDEGELAINPIALNDKDAKLLGERLVDALR